MNTSDATVTFPLGRSEPVRQAAVRRLLASLAPTLAPAHIPGEPLRRKEAPLPLLPGLARLLGVMVGVNIPPTIVLLGWRWTVRRFTTAKRACPATITGHRWIRLRDEVGWTTDHDGGTW